MKDKDILLSIIIYTILTFTQMSFDSLVPSVLANKKIFGGFEMNIKNISFIQMTTSVIALSSCIGLIGLWYLALINPIWSRLTSYRTQIIICCSFLAVCLALYPTQSLFNRSPLFVFFIFHSFVYLFICSFIHFYHNHHNLNNRWSLLSLSCSTAISTSCAYSPSRMHFPFLWQIESALSSPPTSPSRRFEVLLWVSHKHLAVWEDFWYECLERMIL